MIKKDSRLKREYAAYRIMRALIAPVPLLLVQWAGSLSGFFFLLFHRRRRVIFFNLKKAFPGKSLFSRFRIAVRTAMHFGKIALEFIKLAGMNERRIGKLTRIHDIHHLQDALSDGRGAFILSGHFGNWEITAQAIAISGFPQMMVHRPLDNPYLECELSKIRRRFGNELIPKKNATRNMLKALGEGRLIDIVIDQHVPEEMGVVVPFLSLPTPTTPSLAILSMRSGAPVVPIVSRPRGRGYDIFFQKPIRPKDGSDEVQLTTEFNDFLTGEIMKTPHLWLWFHDRWGHFKRKSKKGGGTEVKGED